MTREIYSSNNAPAAIGPYSQACGFGQFVFLSGQIALTADGKDYTDRPVEEQCRIALQNLKSVLEASGCSLESVVKVTIFLNSQGVSSGAQLLNGRHRQDALLFTV